MHPRCGGHFLEALQNPDEVQEMQVYEAAVDRFFCTSLKPMRESVIEGSRNLYVGKAWTGVNLS